MRRVMRATERRHLLDADWSFAIRCYGPFTLSGPVGLADQLNATIAAVAAIACRRDGTLLSPNRPATPIDATFTQLGQSAYSGMRFATRGMAAGSDSEDRTGESGGSGAARPGAAVRQLRHHFGPSLTCIWSVFRIVSLRVLLSHVPSLARRVACSTSRSCLLDAAGCSQSDGVADARGPTHSR